VRERIDVSHLVGKAIMSTTEFVSHLTSLTPTHSVTLYTSLTPTLTHSYTLHSHPTLSHSHLTHTLTYSHSHLTLYTSHYHSLYTLYTPLFTLTIHSLLCFSIRQVTRWLLWVSCLVVISSALDNGLARSPQMGVC
jgi:hypothetical protein